MFLLFSIAFLGLFVWLLSYIPRMKNAICKKKYWAFLGGFVLWICSIGTSAFMAVYGLSEAWSPLLGFDVQQVSELSITLWGLGMTFSLLGLYAYVYVFHNEDFMP